VARAIQATLQDLDGLKKKFSKSLEIVDDKKNGMVGRLSIKSGLGGAVLIEEIRKHRIRFSSRYSAV
jgi:hypothetical protein